MYFLPPQEVQSFTWRSNWPVWYDGGIHWWHTIICHFKTQILMPWQLLQSLQEFVIWSCFQLFSIWLALVTDQDMYKHKHILLPSPARKFKKHKFQHFTIWSADKTSKSLNTMENEWSTPQNNQISSALSDKYWPKLQSDKRKLDNRRNDTWMAGEWLRQFFFLHKGPIDNFFQIFHRHKNYQEQCITGRRNGWGGS